MNWTSTASRKSLVAKPSTTQKFAQCQSSVCPDEELQPSHVRRSGFPPTLRGGTSSNVNVAREDEIPRHRGHAYPDPQYLGAASPRAWAPLLNQSSFSTPQLYGDDPATGKRRDGVTLVPNAGLRLDPS